MIKAVRRLFIPEKFCANCSIGMVPSLKVLPMCQARSFARATMELMRSALGLDPPRYEIDGRLAEISFGAWEGLTYAEILARDEALLDERERDKWKFVPPRGESYAQLTRRVAAWYALLNADTVVAAHGGTARALIAYLEIVPPQEAPHYPVDQGVVYVFAEDKITRYA
jgi:probable phosphoglycerate mutase